MTDDVSQSLVYLFASYEEMAADEVREAEALEWAEGTFGDINDASRFRKISPVCIKARLL